MGCASSRPASHTSHPPIGGHHSSHRHIHADMSSFDTYRGTSYTPKPPPPVARGHSPHHHSPYKPFDFYISHNHHGEYGKSTSIHYPQTHTCYARDISPPRHRNEMPRRHANHRYRDVSPLGSSRFEQLFGRAYIGNGRIGVTAGCNFRGGGIGGWENW
ncbi:hypothetical protein BU25DRAFT_448085 [Macroventuria anomochaeta]|uniref:Uncharacterized protein n=1 Tax=Macroventuria anomochaeta TaxID=301207 RepID=A0ACB6S1I0_9PLEO|nr:uncharacterized protein BU25DRAFT_448085 [Macroventuria anomochaeta]KAF2628095.1 hypothetical protein BU25DRAFT_448085 [Macroventuria anomochaeta]